MAMRSHARSECWTWWRGYLVRTAISYVVGRARILQRITRCHCHVGTQDKCDDQDLQLHGYAHRVRSWTTFKPKRNEIARLMLSSPRKPAMEPPELWRGVGSQVLGRGHHQEQDVSLLNLRLFPHALAPRTMKRRQHPIRTRLQGAR